MSLSSKCTYVLNWSCKGSGETAQMRILIWSFVAGTCSRLIACLNCLWLLNALMFWMGVAKVLARLLKCAYSSELSGCSHIVNCVSMPSNWHYAIIFWMALTRLLRCADSSGLFLPCNKNCRRLCDLLMFWLRVVKTLARLFCADSSEVCSPWRDCAFSQNTFLFWKTNVRKIQNAAVFSATETVIFLDLCEAWINYHFQENVYFRFLKLHWGKLFMLSRKT